MRFERTWKQLMIHCHTQTGLVNKFRVGPGRAHLVLVPKYQKAPGTTLTVQQKELKALSKARLHALKFVIKMDYIAKAREIIYPHYDRENVPEDLQACITMDGEGEVIAYYTEDVVMAELTKNRIAAIKSTYERTALEQPHDTSKCQSHMNGKVLKYEKDPDLYIPPVILEDMAKLPGLGLTLSPLRYDALVIFFSSTNRAIPETNSVNLVRKGWCTAFGKNPLATTWAHHSSLVPAYKTLSLEGERRLMSAVQPCIEVLERGERLTDQQLRDFTHMDSNIVQRRGDRDEQPPNCQRAHLMNAPGV